MATLRPLITICGTTGVGKSKLAIELALALSRGAEHARHGYQGARIINADSMQVYAGMDVITNKVPVDERCGVEHLLMGFKQPGEQYIVSEWVRDAIQLIDETHSRRQIPIVVGGTSYWIQHLIFPNRLASFDQSPGKDRSRSLPLVSEDLAKSLAKLPPELVDLFYSLPEHPPNATTQPGAAFSLHALLSALDPIVAQRWHWKDTRKVLRGLSIIRENGRLSSKVLNEQSEVTVQPRFRTLSFWLYAERAALIPRLDARVDQMIEQGLLNEIRTLREIASAATATSQPTDSSAGTEISPADYISGIYQCIGYKEFHEYLSSSAPSEQLFQNAVEGMKIGTRQYAKRQISWIRNKLLPAVDAANAISRSTNGTTVAPTYLLDATVLGDAWNTQVRDEAERITQSFLKGGELPDPLSLSAAAQLMLTIPDKPTDPTAVLYARRKVVCRTCTTNPEQPVMIEEGKEWAAHVGTRMHRRLLQKAARKPHERENRRIEGVRDDVDYTPDFVASVGTSASL
ncbi:tRNA isopentenyltransferase [Amylocystis lapponica]|nr:tRNA isopentenyltransferase [Amylocystis lapponica]